MRKIITQSLLTAHVGLPIRIKRICFVEFPRRSPIPKSPRPKSLLRKNLNPKSLSRKSLRPKSLKPSLLP